MADIFISYSRRDIDFVAKLASALEDAGFDVWWDQNILFGDWSDQLEQELDRAKRVIAVLTPNAVQARRGYILAEMGRAHEQGKLLPLKVGEFQMPLIFEGLTVRNQTYFFSDFEALLTISALERIYAACGVTKPKAPDSKSSATNWVQSPVSIEQLSLALAVAAFEHTPLALVIDCANSLEQRLREILQEEARPAQSFDSASLLMPRSARLRSIEAASYREEHPRLAVPVEYVRFNDPNRAFDLVEYVWDELEGIRRPLVDWLDDVAKAATPDMRLRLGLIIGALAQSQFTTLFEQVIGRWALSDNPELRAVADIALAIAIVETSAARAVRRIVLDWAVSPAANQCRAAIELSCGLTGSRLPNDPRSNLPNLTIEVLKRIDNSKKVDARLLATMRDGIDFLVRSGRDAADNSLFDLAKLIGELCEWVEASSAALLRQLPLFLFLRIMSQLPASAPSGVAGALSLDRLMARPETRVPTARVFVAALRDLGGPLFEPREAARKTLQRWCRKIVEDRSAASDATREQEPKELAKSDPLLILVQCMYENCRNERDRKRLIFAVRQAYSEQEIQRRREYSDHAAQPEKDGWD